ncbi:dolichyl-diphosphooligosaccharide--protein glycosyltransferase subunit 1, partial [Tulasnella sp. 403]
MRLSSLRRSRAVAATLSYFFLATASLELPKPRSYENTAIVRSIDLAGSTTEVQTTYQVRSLEDNNSAYYIALSEDDAAQLSVMEVKLKGSQTPLEVETHHAPVNNAWLYRVTLPTPLRANDNATIVMNTVLLHGSYPLPEAVRQNEPQRLVYETGLYVPSSYETVLQRTKFRVPHPEIISFTDTPALHKYADAANNKAVTRSGVTITYGPFHFVPATTTPSFNEEEQQLIKIHYTYDAPVIAVPKLRRLAEVSHWGANLNIQDEIWLKNNGA